MLAAMILNATLGTNFVHTVPSPPADIPVEVYQNRRARLMAALGGCLAVISAQGEVGAKDGVGFFGISTAAEVHGAQHQARENQSIR